MLQVYREYHYGSAEREKLYPKDHSEGYTAVPYTDHYDNGVDVCGAEDFSTIRWIKSVVERCIYVPTGKRQQNGDGRRTWEYSGRSIYSRSGRDCGKIAKMVMGDQEYSLRQY